ncbi:LTA synthase family protein [Desulfovibrio sp. OttesenSCG-928-C06]|nr:LTA synthase family protein [Desulfovibrio sp. OttesenSCG-928-C06]
MKKFRYQPLPYAEKIAPLLKSMWLLLILMTLAFMGSRYVMFRDFTISAELEGYGTDILRMWTTGLRYDARVCAIMLIPIFGLGIICSPAQSLWRLFLRLGPVLAGIAALISALFAIGNYYYYQTYNNFIDIFVFGFMGEDQAAVLGNIWDDYPVLPVTAAVLIFTLLCGWLCAGILRAPQAARLKRAYMPRRKRGSGKLFWAAILSCALFFLIARGSIDTFPLGRNDARISSQTVLNKLTPNGLITLYWAWGDHNEEVRFHSVTMQEGAKLLKKSGLPSIMGRTPENTWLRENRPHVVLSMMESFGSNMLALDDMPGNDLLGALRRHFKSDFLFTRFVSFGNGTAPSMAGLFFNSPVQNISHSAAQGTPLSYTLFRVYKDAGYKTVFIYPGNMMWRNMEHYLPLQGVDALYDQNDLNKLYPESVKDQTAWGVPDEYAYKLAEKLLLESDEPLFIGILTTTNHPPYRIPSTYSPAPVNVSPQAAAHLADPDDLSLLMLGTYQYSANALGVFMDRLKASPIGSNTLVAATGDHQMRRMRIASASERAQYYGVPFYLYVPKEILEQTNWAFEANRPGSHKDILPTLLHFSLDNAEYLSLGGRNMLAAEDDKSAAFGFNSYLWIDADGTYLLDDSTTLRPWATADGMLLESDESYRKDRSKSARIKAYHDLLSWQINARVSGLDVSALDTPAAE